MSETRNFGFHVFNSKIMNLLRRGNEILVNRNTITLSPFQELRVNFTLFMQNCKVNVGCMVGSLVFLPKSIIYEAVKSMVI